MMKQTPIEFHGLTGLKIQTWEHLAKFHLVCDQASGHDFSRADRAIKVDWALAPAVFSVICISAAAKAGILFGHLRHE
jgi:hypothetical protein